MGGAKKVFKTVTRAATAIGTLGLSEAKKMKDKQKKLKEGVKAEEAAAAEEDRRRAAKAAADTKATTDFQSSLTQSGGVDTEKLDVKKGNLFGN